MNGWIGEWTVRWMGGWVVRGRDDRWVDGEWWVVPSKANTSNHSNLPHVSV